MLRHLSVMLVFVLTAAHAYADVRVTRRSQFTSDDPAFRRMPKELLAGQDHTVIVKGDRMMRINGPYVAEIVDLQEERIYSLDLRRKTYSVRTFAQVRGERERLQQQTEKMKADVEEQLRKYREAEARVRVEQEQRAASRGRRRQPAEEKVIEKTEDERLREFVQNYEHASGPTGQRRTILGFDAQEVVSTTRMGPTDDSPSGMAMTVTHWLADIPELREIDAFEDRFRNATGEAAPPRMSASLDTAAVAAAIEANPIYVEMMNRITVDDSVKGTPVLTITKGGPAMTDDGSTKSGDDTRQRAKSGGLLGGIGRQAGRSFGLPGFGRPAEKAAERPTPAMTTRQEMVEFSRTVSEEEVAIPAGFKEVKPRE